MNVTLQYFDDCPNWRVVELHLIELGREFDDLHVELQLIDTPEDAERYRFRGSPSILVDGVDPFARSDDPIGAQSRHAIDRVSSGGRELDRHGHPVRVSGRPRPRPGLRSERAA